MAKRKNNNVLVGVAGEYFAAAELSRRGYVASITSKNTKGIDILASSQDAKVTVAIQVKTCREGKNKWILNKKSEEDKDANLYYIFVNLNGNGKPSYFVVPSEVVAKECQDSYNKWFNEKEHQPTNIRNIEFNQNSEYFDAWNKLGLERLSTANHGID